MAVPRIECKLAAMIAEASFATDVTGATNSKPITKFECATAATPSTAEPATKWINARIVPRWFVIRVRR